MMIYYIELGKTVIDNIFKGLIDTELTQVIEVSDFLICVGTALAIGVILALINTFRNRYTKSFIVTVAVLPAIVCVVIMMVNGNIGAGVAVAGAFSLVRFRSAPGSARDIATIFLSMGAGLIVGMGYIGYAVLFVLIIGAFLMLMGVLGIGQGRKANGERILKITVPESLNYTDLFQDLFLKYLKSYNQISVKTSAMGSLYKLKYNVCFKSVESEKEFIDEIRCRNGNLEVQIYDRESEAVEL